MSQAPKDTCSGNKARTFHLLILYLRTACLVDPASPANHTSREHLHTAVHHETTPRLLGNSKDSLLHCQFPPVLHEETGLSQHPAGTIHPFSTDQAEAISIQQW